MREGYLATNGTQDRGMVMLVLVPKFSPPNIPDLKNLQDTDNFFIYKVAKQRGEEYRIHGQHGWLWLSATRNFCPSNAMKLGLRAGPHRVAVKYTDIRDKSFKIVLMEPNAFEYLLKKQDEIDLRKAMGLTEEEIAAADENTDKSDDAKNKERLKLEQALKNARFVIF
jgi:nucleosome-remodeling factor subunit BPTF